MKKFILLFLSCIMVMSGTVTSFAEEGGEAENTVSFEVQIEGIDGTVLFEKVDLQLGEETVYLADVLKMLDEENDDLEIVLGKYRLTSVNGVEAIDDVSRWKMYCISEGRLGLPVVDIERPISQFSHSERYIFAYCMSDSLGEFPVSIVNQESYKDGKMFFTYEDYYNGRVPRADLNVSLTSVATGETEEYVTNENGEIDLSDTKLSGEVYVNYWQTDDAGNPLALRPLKNERIIVLPEVVSDNTPDTADNTALFGIVIAAAVAMGVVAKKKRSA